MKIIDNILSYVAIISVIAFLVPAALIAWFYVLAGYAMLSISFGGV